MVVLVLHHGNELARFGQFMISKLCVFLLFFGTSLAIYTIAKRKWGSPRNGHLVSSLFFPASGGVSPPQADASALGGR
jgi:hypothetical protein